MPDMGDAAAVATLDAGEQNCAALIVNIRTAITSLAPGELLKVIAYDPSAQLDLRAWSRMTGHCYVSMEDHGRFTGHYLRKREDSHGQDPGVRELR
jgi:tRNA 2-thiouridine synthesizing protein A